MDGLKEFAGEIKSLALKPEFDAETARKVILAVNDFFFTTEPSLGTLRIMGQDRAYFSAFHKYWEKNYKEIIGAFIDDEQCRKIADALHIVYQATEGKAFHQANETQGLPLNEFCRVRILTANQDFRGSRSNKDMVKAYLSDKAKFDLDWIISNPEAFIAHIESSRLSQTDKRSEYAKNIALFLKENGAEEPVDIIKSFDNDLLRFKEALTSFTGAGYGNKKADMLIRDMVVLGAWEKAKNYDKINVASDVNTVKVALRTGILQTKIPLVSSFLDQFCYQYGYIDQMSAQAWRRIWEIWQQQYPSDKVESPSLLDFLIYDTIGRQLCRSGALKLIRCSRCGKQDYVARKIKCQHCKGETETVETFLPCDSPHEFEYVKTTSIYAQNLFKPNLTSCPFKPVCDEYGKKYLDAPKSISIIGQTGWTSSYSSKGKGGGGMMG